MCEKSNRIGRGMGDRLARSRSLAQRRRCPPLLPSSSTRSSEATVIVLGHQNVGKTALVSQFLWSGFIEEYSATVEEFNWIEYESGEEERLLLQVIDSGGSRDFLAMRHLYIRTGDAFLVVFAVDDVESFEEAKVILAEITDAKREKVSLLLVANKGDLFEKEEEWAVKGVREYAMLAGVPLTTITAKDTQQVAEAFRVLLEGIRGTEMQGIRTGQLKKRRQSMPVTTGARNTSSTPSTIHPSDLERLQRKARGRDAPFARRKD